MDHKRLCEEMLFARVVEASLKHVHRPTLKAVLRLAGLKGKLLSAYLFKPSHSKESPESKAMRQSVLDLELEMCREIGAAPGTLFFFLLFQFFF